MYPETPHPDPLLVWRGEGECWRHIRGFFRAWLDDMDVFYRGHPTSNKVSREIPFTEISPRLTARACPNHSGCVRALFSIRRRKGTKPGISDITSMTSLRMRPSSRLPRQVRRGN